MTDIIKKIATEFKIRERQVEATVNLIDEGSSIPFIARYRKEATGGLDDDILRELNDRLTYLRGLKKRKEEVINLIAEQGKLTDELKSEILAAEVLQRVEDLYKPYKQKKATRASKAKAKGLEPLALLIFAQEITEDTCEEGAEKEIEKLAIAYINPEKEVNTPEDAISGACDIIAEMISDDINVLELIRDMTGEEGMIVSEAVDSEAKSVYEKYYGASEPISKIPNHRILAINRGEKEKFIKVKVQVDAKRMTEAIEGEVITNKKSIFAGLLRETVEDSYKRLIQPTVEREMRSMLTERAEAEAVNVFAKNTEKLLMTPPVKQARVIAIDPGYRTGCKVAVLDETGRLLAYTTIYPTKPKEDIAGTRRVLDKIIDKYDINTIVIGNGTAGRETEEVIASYIKDSGRDIKYTIVNEAGASVYSASKLAAQEYPDLDVTTRGAMSLGRRLQDPLAELVKIPIKSIGVGQYQHDINQKNLEKALDDVVEDCVNKVGVNLNTASASLLEHVAGINSSIAKNIVAYREEHGRFNERKELNKVAKLGPKAYEQCAGFLRIVGGKNPLDATAVHPESYAAAEKLLAKIKIDKAQLAKGGDDKIEEKLRKNGYSLRELADELEIGEFTIKDIVEEIKKPARDPRDAAPQVIFRTDVKSFDDLTEGMEMMGTVRNVVDFGAFVDIGVKNDGLVHISQLSTKYIKHPMDVVAVGDTVKVKILSVDRDKQKISLTMKI